MTSGVAPVSGAAIPDVTPVSGVVDPGVAPVFGAAASGVAPVSVFLMWLLLATWKKPHPFKSLGKKHGDDLSMSLLDA